jgi:hypothetical protein
MTDDRQSPLFTNGHPGSADSCEELAQALCDELTESGDMALLDYALELDRESLRLRPERHQDRASPSGPPARLRLLDEAATGAPRECWVLVVAA